MKWNDKFKSQQLYNEISNYDEKLEVAKMIAKKVKNGEVIGFGSGSTSYLAVLEIGKRVKEENLDITAIPTSDEIRMVCSNLGIKTATLNELKPDWCFDGADEVDQNNSLIKGRGGAMFQEKIIMRAASKAYILVDANKIVNKLGEKFKVPVEVYPKALTYVTSELYKLGATEVVLRIAKAKDGPIITESGNYIVDVKFENIEKDYEAKVKGITGVIESGLFIGYPVEIIVPSR